MTATTQVKILTVLQAMFAPYAATGSATRFTPVGAKA